MSTLVTGATGFVGSHVARLLAARGDELRVSVRAGSNLEGLDGVDAERVTCDLLDRRAVRRALKGVDRVFHSAGLVSLQPGDADRLFEVNVKGTRILFEEALRAGVERVVHTSCATAIGAAPTGQTADEQSVFTVGGHGITYVNSKHEAELEGMRLATQGLPVVFVNPTFVMGRGDVGGSSTGLVKRFLLGRVPAYAQGAVNVVDVEDVARGHLLADEHGRVGERYILGNRNYTFDRLFADLSRISGVEPPALRLSPAVAMRFAELLEATPGPAPAAPDEIRASSLWWTYRSGKARRELGWRTQPHEDTLEATVGWYLEREGERIARSRRSQPIGYRLAAATLGTLGGAAGVAGRLWPRAASA